MQVVMVQVVFDDARKRTRGHPKSASHDNPSRRLYRLGRGGKMLACGWLLPPTRRGVVKPRVRTSAVCCMLHVRVSAAHADGTPDTVSMCQDITATALKLVYGLPMVNDKHVPRPRWVVRANNSLNTETTWTLSRWLACSRAHPKPLVAVWRDVDKAGA